MPRYSHRCKITTNIPFPMTARLRLSRFSAASITNTGGKELRRKGKEAQWTLRFACVSPISGGCTGGTAGAFRLQRDAQAGGRTPWFLSVPGSSPALAKPPSSSCIAAATSATSSPKSATPPALPKQPCQEWVGRALVLFPRLHLAGAQIAVVPAQRFRQQVRRMFSIRQPLRAVQIIQQQWFVFRIRALLDDQVRAFLR